MKRVSQTARLEPPKRRTGNWKQRIFKQGMRFHNRVKNTCVKGKYILAQVAPYTVCAINLDDGNYYTDGLKTKKGASHITFSELTKILQGNDPFNNWYFEGEKIPFAVDSLPRPW
jgi:hypothetical protein